MEAARPGSPLASRTWHQCETPEAASVASVLLICDSARVVALPQLRRRLLKSAPEDAWRRLTLFPGRATGCCTGDAVHAIVCRVYATLDALSDRRLGRSKRVTPASGLPVRQKPPPSLALVLLLGSVANRLRLMGPHQFVGVDSIPVLVSGTGPLLSLIPSCADLPTSCFVSLPAVCIDASRLGVSKL
ncbi:hypothetical protein TgHK011_008432 [Trichoderma gracile]|nr:hypothetical protein TgHK011_008432 [Trichoderma gracile]